MATPRSKRLLALAAALLLGAACRRAPPEAPEQSPELAPLPPSSSLIATPLDSAATGYTNEMQADNLSRESSELGILHIGRYLEESEPNQENADATPSRTKVSRKARLARLKEMRQELTRARRGIDDARDKSVALPGATAAVISGRESGTLLGPVANGPGVWSGSFGGAVEAGERVVESAAAWTELWGRLSRETPPDVDFSKNRVAAVFVGPRPTSGYRAKLVGVGLENGRYLLRWLEEGPGPGESVSDGTTAPFLLVSVPKDERAIRWDKARRDAGRADRPGTK